MSGKPLENFAITKRDSAKEIIDKIQNQLAKGLALTVEGSSIILSGDKALAELRIFLVNNRDITSTEILHIFHEIMMGEKQTKKLGIKGIGEESRKLILEKINNDIKNISQSIEKMKTLWLKFSETTEEGHENSKLNIYRNLMLEYKSYIKQKDNYLSSIKQLENIKAISSDKRKYDAIIKALNSKFHSLENETDHKMLKSTDALSRTEKEQEKIIKEFIEKILNLKKLTKFDFYEIEDRVALSRSSVSLENHESSLKSAHEELNAQKEVLLQIAEDLENAYKNIKPFGSYYDMTETLKSIEDDKMIVERKLEEITKKINGITAEQTGIQKIKENSELLKKHLVDQKNRIQELAPAESDSLESIIEKQKKLESEQTNFQSFKIPENTFSSKFLSETFRNLAKQEKEIQSLFEPLKKQLKTAESYEESRLQNIEGLKVDAMFIFAELSNLQDFKMDETINDTIDILQQDINPIEEKNLRVKELKNIYDDLKKKLDPLSVEVNEILEKNNKLRSRDLVIIQDIKKLYLSYEDKLQRMKDEIERSSKGLEEEETITLTETQVQASKSELPFSGIKLNPKLPFNIAEQISDPQVTPSNLESKKIKKDKIIDESAPHSEVLSEDNVSKTPQVNTSELQSKDKKPSIIFSHHISKKPDINPEPIKPKKKL